MSENFVAYVRFRLPDGRSQRVTAGSLIGRASRAELCLKSPDLSEAHAFISLRGNALFLLALRRWVSLDGALQREVVLEVGQRIALSHSVVLEVEQVEVPDRELVLVADSEVICALTEPVYSISWQDHEFSIEKQYNPTASAWIWGDSEGLWLQIGNQTPQRIKPGTTFELAGCTFSVAASARQAVPTTSPAGIYPPMQIRIRRDSVMIESPFAPPLILNGKRAAVLIHLARLGRVVEWHFVAERIWPGETDMFALRRKWDRHKSDAHTALRAASLRSDLM